MKEITKESFENYLKNERQVCPRCGGSVGFGNIEVDGDETSQTAFCQDCDLRYIEVYAFTRLIDVESGQVLKLEEN